jgi:uncharacterized membrane protein
MMAAGEPTVYYLHQEGSQVVFHVYRVFMMWRANLL